MADDTHSRFATVSENDIQFLASGWPYDKAYGARSFVRHLNMMNPRLKCRTMADDILSLSRTCFVYLLAKQRTTLKWKNVFHVFIFTMQIGYIYFAHQMQFTAISVSEAPSMKPAAAYTLPIRYLQHRMLLCGHMSIICCQWWIVLQRFRCQNE